eukprot:7619001-Lingulodinium_polyedra.AAC.1
MFAICGAVKHATACLRPSMSRNRLNLALKRFQTCWRVFQCTADRKRVSTMRGTVYGAARCGHMRAICGAV